MLNRIPRLTLFLIVSLVLMALAFLFQGSASLLSISFYKAHLLSLGGWGGYWIDRAIFPYARPSAFRDDPDRQTLHAANLRRAIIVAASVICIGLAA
jgi:hypothetical protein